MFLLFLILLILLAAWYCYKIAFYAPESKRVSADRPITGEQYLAVADDIRRVTGIMAGYTYEEVTIQSYDGSKLFGRYYHMADGAPVELLFHGYRSHPYRDCSGGHAMSRKLKLNTLVVDQRSHGASDGHTISFGVRERKDCLAWAEYAANRFGTDTPLILSGLSMGAATVLMASELELPKSVTCIIADSPYSAPKAIIEKVCVDKGYPLFLCRPFLWLGALIYGGFRLNSCSATDAVRHAKVPILLLHGEDDRLVPCEMSMEIAANCASRVEVATFPDAGHGLCYLTDPVRYEEVVSAFLRSVPELKSYLQ